MSTTKPDDGKQMDPMEMATFIEVISEKLLVYREEDEMNVLINCIKNAVDRRGSYPLFVVEAIIEILDARSLMAGLSPGSKRLDN